PSWREDMEQLTRLSYVEHVSFQGAIPTELLESLDSFPRLRSLTLSIAPAISSQQEGANIKKEDLVASRDLRKLRRLSLDVLHIHGLAIAVEDLDRLLAEVEPRELLLVRSKLDENAIRGLRKNHPGVHVMVYE